MRVRRRFYTGDVHKEGQMFSLLILASLLIGTLTCALSRNYLLAGLLGLGLIGIGVIYNVIRDLLKRDRA